MPLKRYFYLFLVLGILISSSCDDSKLDISADGISINIENSSGDDFWYDTEDGRKYFAPYPFNTGRISVDDTEYQVILLSQKVKKGSKHEVSGLAEFTLRASDGSEEHILVTVPTNEKIKLFETSDFNAFAVEQFAFKQILELWYSNNRGLEGTIVENWRPASLGTVSSQ